MKKLPKFIALCIIESGVIFLIGSLMNLAFDADINVWGFVVAAATAGIVISFASAMLFIDSHGKWHLP
jgi:hypothetical protein